MSAEKITSDVNLPNAPGVARESVLVESGDTPETAVVQGYDFNQGVDYNALLDSYFTSGFQATNFGRAVKQLNRMISWRLSDEPVEEGESDEYLDPETRANTRCKIFLGYTSNLISSGLRESIRYLVQNRMVDVLVSSAGGIEEDVIKCLAPTYLGDFALKGKGLRDKGLNRIGNLLIPNDNYGKFQEFLFPLLDTMLEEQKAGKVWSPSNFIHRLGLEIDDDSSVLTWAARNNIPVFCPSLTDGSIGDMIYFHSYENPGFVLDIASDIRRMNNQAVFAKKTGMIIFGGGLVKHHILNANLMRNGGDFAVLVNTASEFDGSDAGARPDEAISWGKIRDNADPVKIYAEATLVVPLLIAQSFAKNWVPKTDPIPDYNDGGY